MRIQLSEVTPARIWSALDFRARNLFHQTAWSLSGNSRLMLERLERYRDKHKGERCFVIANGPSLKSMDVSLIESEVTFGMNRVYLMFEDWGFSSTYLACVNSLVMEQFREDFEQLAIPKFLNWNSRNGYDLSNDTNNFFRVQVKIKDTFEGDLLRPIGGGGTVTFACLQIAYFMGFSEVIIIGMDHSFAEKGRPNKTEVRQTEEDASHCHPDYFPKGIKWQLPDLYRSEIAYALARQAYEADGRRILDATAGGKCDVFEKVDFRDVV